VAVNVRTPEEVLEMATSLSVEDVRAQLGQSEPQDDEQQISLRIWEQLPDEWQLEDDFLEQLRQVAGLEDYQGADLSALFMSLHSADYVQVRRAPGRNLREARRHPSRPRFYSFEERSDNSTGERLEDERQRRERELEAAEDHRRALESPQRAVERQEVLEHLAQSPVVAEIKSELSDLERDVSFLRTRIALLERGAKGETEPASAG
jgi:hypothetical protein